MRVPARLALLLWDCGAALELKVRTKIVTSKESMASVFFMVPPLPHARELEGWPVQRGLHGLQTSPVSWLGKRNSGGRGRVKPAATPGRSEGRPLQGLLAAFPCRTVPT